MKKRKGLYTIIIRLIFIRLLIPLSSIYLIVMGIMAYQMYEEVLKSQNQKVKAVERIADHYLGQSKRILDAVGIAVEESNLSGLEAFMKATWKSYGYFDTIYYLNSMGKINVMVPNENRYLGIDMSNIPDFKDISQNNTFKISRPFISLRTGEPTIYMVYPIKSEGYVVGELRLSLLQDEIEKEMKIDKTKEGQIFIVDQYGGFLAHPQKKLVKEQVNEGNLNLYKESYIKDKTLIYEKNGINVVSKSSKLREFGWIVVDEIEINSIIAPYIIPIAVALFFFVSICIILTIDLKEKIKRDIIYPIMQLRKSTKALSTGNFEEGIILTDILSSFEEVNQLSMDFHKMSDSLWEAQNKLEIKVEERTTELSALNEELIATNEELSNALEELKVTQEQLVEAEKIAALVSLVAGIAHEINTPIGVAITATSYMKDITEATVKSIGEGKLAKKQFIEYMETLKESLDILEASLNKGSKLVQSFKSIAIDQTEDILKEVNVKKYIEDILFTIEHEFKNKKISIEVECHESLQLKTFAGALSQVISNILLNSIQHAFKDRPSGKIIINVVKEKNMVLISIKDNGIGIEEDIKTKIFEPFFTTTRSERHIGLGLSIVYSIVNGRLKGNIKCESSIGEGSEFIIQFLEVN